ncbi:MAG: PP2C family protein-serine/threonine phosphatase [Candidatus Acidiferrum sp.]
MPVATNSWSTIWLPRLRNLLRAEQQVVFIGVLISALFAVLKTGAPIVFLGICVLTIGNLMYFLMYVGARLYADRTFPWNWIAYLALLTVGSVVAALGAVALLIWMKPEVGPYWQAFKVSLPIVLVVSIGAGIVTYAVQQIQFKLQEKNKLLEQEVQRGSVALEQQEEELNRARDIQTGLLPKSLPQHANLELAGAWQPARAIGGDYFDVVQLDENRFGICIGDVAGKGLTASLLMANLQAAFRAYATPDATPAAVCSKLNAFVCGNVATGKFITFFYAILDAQKRTLIYENAGHCPALLLHAAGAPEVLCGQGGVLGITPEWTYVDATMQLAGGDRLLLFTDGVTEAANAQEVEFGSSRIVESAGTAATSANETKSRVMQEVAKFCGGDFRDDVTLVVAAIR